jgi:hypothetical protein
MLAPTIMSAISHDAKEVQSVDQPILYNPCIDAAKIRGHWINNDISTALCHGMPNQRAVVYVHANRDIPGNSATPCAMPSIKTRGNVHEVRGYSGQKRNENNRSAVITSPTPVMEAGGVYR